MHHQLIPNPTDAHASRQSHAGGNLQRYRQRDSDHFKSRGLPVIVARGVECSGGRRFVRKKKLRWPGRRCGEQTQQKADHLP